MKRPRKTAAILCNPAAALELLKRKIQVDEKTGCHIWQGSKNYNGYGQVRIEGIQWAVHRLMYELTFGPISQDASAWWILHKCDTPGCCNPDHLYAGTPTDNSRDMANRCRGRVGYRPLSAAYGRNFDPSRRTGTVFYEYCGEIKRLADWAEQFGLSPTTLDLRFQAGWPPESIPIKLTQGFRHAREDCTMKYRRFSGEHAVREYMQSKKGASDAQPAAQ